MEEKKTNKAKDYFSTQKTDFFSLLLSTKKWKELYNQRESKIAVFFALCITCFLHIAYKNTEFSDFMELLNNLLQIAIETSVGMLGFIISGLAIFTGTITSKLVRNIDSDNKINSIIGILYSFYFIGAIIGINIVVYISLYVFAMSDIVFNEGLFVLISGFSLYLYLFSIFYSISLLGTCIRLFFVSYKYSEEDKKINKND